MGLSGRYTLHSIRGTVITMLERGFGDQHTFHSIRKAVVTILENAGVAENIVADLVGHAKRTITFGLYSGGVGIDVKRAALAKLSY